MARVFRGGRGITAGRARQRARARAREGEGERGREREQERSCYARRKGKEKKGMCFSFFLSLLLSPSSLSLSLCPAARPPAHPSDVRVHVQHMQVVVRGHPVDADVCRGAAAVSADRSSACGFSIVLLPPPLPPYLGAAWRWSGRGGKCKCGGRAVASVVRGTVRLTKETRRRCANVNGRRPRAALTARR